MNLCPCLQACLNKLLGKKKQRSSYEGARQFEEQQFMNPNMSDQIKPSKKIPIFYTDISNTPYASELYETDGDEKNKQFDVKLKLQSSHPQESIQRLIQLELLSSPPPAVNIQSNIQNNKNEEVIFSDTIDFTSFSINLDPIDPHYSLLSDKTHNMKDLFKEQGNLMEIGFPNKAGLQIKKVESNKGNAFFIKYKLNCSYSYYLSIIKNEKLALQFSPLIAEMKTIESLKPNLTLNIYKFKKIGSFEARDFTYYKFQNGSKGQHWQIYLNDDNYKATENNLSYKTCQIFCIANIRQKDQNQMFLTQYLWIDFQTSNIANILPKLMMQYKNYLNNIQDYLQKNYEDELV